MIFTKEHAAQVLDGRKRQTRRPVKSGDILIETEGGAAYIWNQWTRRRKWMVGYDYAVQPGRGKKSIGRTPPLKEIRRERLGQITRADISAEGVRDQPKSAYSLYDARSVFARLWDSLYRKPYRWEDNPFVWCLSFELVERYNGVA